MRITLLIEQIRASSFARRLFTLSAGTALAQGISLLGLVVIARLYTPADFGFFATASACIWLTVVLETLQMEHLIMNPKEDDEAFRVAINVMLSSLVGGFLTFGILHIVAQFFQELASARDIRFQLIFSSTVVFIGWSQAGRYWLLRKNHLSTLSVSAFATAIVSSLSGIVYGLISDTEGRWLGLVLSQLLGWIACVYVMFRDSSVTEARRDIKISFDELVVTFYTHLKAGCMLTTAHFLKTSYVRMPVLILSSAVGPGAAGLYGMVERVVGAPVTLIANASGDVFRQHVIDALHGQKPLVATMLKVVKVTALFSIPIYGIGALASPFLFGFVFGNQWIEGGMVAAILLIGDFFLFTFNPVDRVAISLGHNRYVLLSHAVRFFAKIILFAAALYFELSLIQIIIGLTIIRAVHSAGDFYFNLQFAGSFERSMQSG